MEYRSPSFAVYEEPVKSLFGTSPTLEMLHENKDYPFAHEAGVYIETDNTLFITSNQYADPATGKKKIQISKVTLNRCNGKTTAKVEEIHPEGIPMGNGGVNYEDGVLFCAQGGPDPSKQAGGLVHMEPHPPYRTRNLVSTFHGRLFNSVNDVVMHSDGSIWFTDPIYGYEQRFRPEPQLPCQVYRFVPTGGVDGMGSIRVVADGFGRPNGICFSPDEKFVYITDTDWMHGGGITDLTRASTIYAFDVVYYSGQPFLANRRLFAMVDTGIPDGIKCDVHGNVYSGCGDGINVWSPGGVLLGKILVEGGAANFCFGKEGELFILNEYRLWRAQLDPSTKGALLGI
ncbi:Gluconolactonase [Cytospora mali]|uniref:Gluconolactonase n=1 Tax=Cytospora mali TaxID=578113 RepID=A0A194VQK2_CYTMA|nr:Gluconolactonase [Valsa mali]